MERQVNGHHMRSRYANVRRCSTELSFTIVAFHPHKCAKSKNPRRSDVSQNSRRAQSDAKVSPNDIEVRANDIEKAHSVAKGSHSVAKRPVVAADVKSRASTQIAMWVRDTANHPSICDRRAAILALQNRKNTPKNGFGASAIVTYVDSERRISPEKRFLTARSEPFRDELSLGGARGVICQFRGCDPFAGGVKRRAKRATSLLGFKAG